MEPDRTDAVANEGGPTRLLASFLDDCCEPEEAEALLRQLAARDHGELAQAGTPLGLRVVRGDLDSAGLISFDYECDKSEEPGSADYLWVLWVGSAPTRDVMIALFREFLLARLLSRNE
jgi:hypothetical protein